LRYANPSPQTLGEADLMANNTIGQARPLPLEFKPAAKMGFYERQQDAEHYTGNLWITKL
jgi:hypothetical protein